ncbi:microsomal glutathione S-transferase 1-like [Montipora capricornis]|uniref:microsomal glutathione S-transferase 1-like n=1 Tax=Montipora capricornis TaxID=246305 RepID=UPI0035F112AF
MVTLTVDERLFAAYIFYGGILVLKTFFMSFLTGRQRMKNHVPPSPEDYGEKNKGKPIPTCEDVDRVRRAHQNDLENIPIFLIIALLYTLLNLPPVRGIWCLRIFTAARILHTVAYLNAIHAPRGIGFICGSICLGILVVSVLYSAVIAGVF